MRDEHMINEAIKEDIHMEVLNENVRDFVRKLNGVDRQRAGMMICMSETALDLDENTVQDFIAYLDATHTVAVQGLFEIKVGNEVDNRIEQKADSWVS